MALKKIQYDVQLLSTETALQVKVPVVYTNDLNSVEFVFNILDMTAEQLEGATATTLLYMRDGSFFQNSDVNLNGNTFTYLLKENEGNHVGLAKIQLVVNIPETSEQNYPTQLFNFEVVAGLETKVAKSAVEVMIHDWTTLTREARSYIDQFVADEATRQQQFDDAQTARTNIFTQSETERTTSFEEAEELRQQKETERQEAESKRIEAEQLRVEAEGTRQSEFEDNEANRTKAFNANETTRQENESIRQQAEAQRATAESVRVANEEQRKIDHANRIAEFAKKEVEVLDNSITTNKIDAITPKWYSMLALGTVANPSRIARYDVNTKKVVLETDGKTGLVKLDLTSDDVNIVGKLDTDTMIYWGKVIVITDSVDTFLSWESVTDVETAKKPFLSYDASTKKFVIDIAVLKQSYPTATSIYLAYTKQFTPIIYRKLHLSQFDWLQPIETAEIKDGAITQPKIKIDEELVLPAVIPCVVGREMNCYWENALLYGRINAVQKIDTEYTLSNSERFRDRFIWKPTSVNSTSMKVMLWKKSLKQIDDSKVVSFKAVSATAGTGTKKVLVIGDSKTAYGQIVRKLKGLFDTDSAMDIEYLGTRYDNNNNGDVTYKHEGRGGWSISDYVRVASKGSVTNPFYNASTFDFSKYMVTQSYASVDYVIINLSTNDFGRPITDVIADLNTMISSIKKFNRAIKVIVCLTEGVYRNKMEWDTRNTWVIELKKLMIATFDKRESEKIYVCPLYLNMDLYEDYTLTSVPLSSEDTTKTRLMTADGIHQNQVGFNKNANTMYYTIKYIESLG